MTTSAADLRSRHAHRAHGPSVRQSSARRSLWLAVTAAALAAGSLSGCVTSSGSGSGGISAPPPRTLVIASDLPLQGASAETSIATNNMIKLYLAQIGNKVGEFTIQFKEYDNSTAASGAWDPATCAKNAQAHAASAGEVAVLGTFDSGCTAIEAPVLNKAAGGPVLMVSSASTAVGLTRPWDPGEPEAYFPTGDRSFARVVPADDYQGSAMAEFAAQQLGLKKCYLVNDGQAYGAGVARAFVSAAAKVGIEVLGNDPWDPDQASYRDLFERVKLKNPDCVIVSGIYDLNGSQLVKDKVAVLGGNDEIPVIASDGFVGYPEFQRQLDADGVYLAFPGVDPEHVPDAGPAAQQLLNAYRATYGELPPSRYVLTAVSALQVILAAIERSDGSRESVSRQVFSGDGISIPAAVSATGAEVSIDPATGDVTDKDISMLRVQGGSERFVQVIPG